MPVSPTPEVEARRLQVLFSLNILDTPAEERFDRITRLASRLFNVPIALVSVVDEHRLWFKSRFGYPHTQTERSMSFCEHAIQQEGIMVVEDASQDARFAGHPVVAPEDGLRFYAGSPLKASDGTPIGTLCLIDRQPRAFNEEEQAVLRDLASIVANEMAAVELNRAMQRQRDSEAGLRALLEYMPEGVLLMDGAGTILYVNPAAERIFRCTTDDLVGHPGHTLAGEDLDSIRAREGLANLTPIECTGKRCDGTLFPLEFTLNRVLLGGEQRVTAIVRDISRRHEAEARNRATDERRRKHFSTATHELRTPMASVLGFSELLLKRDFDAATGRELVEIIHRQASRLVSLINQLLDLARIEAGGKEDLDIGPLAVPELVEQTLAGLTGLGDTARIDVRLQDGLPLLLGDAHKLQQALMNILSNAIKYSAPGTPIELDATRTERAGVSAVALRVKDHGIGMTAEQQGQIFDAFYRADAGASVPGSGLGMTIFKEIIDLHGGTVELASRPGSGTSVTMVLPATEERHG